MKTSSLILSIFLVFFNSSAYTENLQDSGTQFNEDVRMFILANPEVILESLKRYEEKIMETVQFKEKELIDREFKALKLNKSSYIGGNPNGSITLIEFIDYKCGYCKRAHGEISKLIKANPEIRFVVKEFPILGDESLIASKASIAILLEQDKIVYKEFTDELLKFTGTINIDFIKDTIKSIGGNTVGIQEKMESKEVSDILQSNYALAKNLNIRGTPTFIIGTEIVRGYKDIKTLQDIINKRKQEL